MEDVVLGPYDHLEILGRIHGDDQEDERDAEKGDTAITRFIDEYLN